jgi:phospholipid/cholesterol/gamma-HCH transport system permease protein
MAKSWTASPAIDPPWDLRVSRSAEGTLVVHLSGGWRLRNRPPGAATVVREIGAGAPVRRLTFETRDLKGWDSGLLTFLWELVEEGWRRGFELDQTGLPAGVQRLLSLASAVQPREAAQEAKPPPWLERVGDAARARSAEAMRMVAFVGDMGTALGAFVCRRTRFLGSDLARLLEECGARALPIVSLISFLVGLIVAFVGAEQLRRFGAETYVADLVGIATVRELGPIMTAIIMAGRTGAAFAAQLGTMQVNEEIDALRTTGLSPVEFLVLPRMLGLSLMTPLLTLYGDVVGILGGACIAAGLLHVSAAAYFHATVAALRLTDLGLGLVKGALFGILVAFAGCLRGSESGRSAAAVGQAATSAVVLGIVLIIVSDAALDVLFNALKV